MKTKLIVKLYQQDWTPGFAAFLDNGSVKKGTAHISLNLGAFMAALACKDIPRKDLPYVIAESIMHELIHVLEAWAGVEFNHRRINLLMEKYRKKYARKRKI